MNIRSSIMNQLSLQGGAMIRKDAANIGKLEKDSTAAKQGEGCVDPLTGGFISKEEFDAKYDGGKTTVYVKDERFGGYTRMTADAYVRKYGNSANPPQAYLKGEAPRGDAELIDLSRQRKD